MRRLSDSERALLLTRIRSSSRVTAAILDQASVRFELDGDKLYAVVHADDDEPVEKLVSLLVRRGDERRIAEAVAIEFGREVHVTFVGANEPHDCESSADELGGPDDSPEPAAAGDGQDGAQGARRQRQGPRGNPNRNGSVERDGKSPTRLSFAIGYARHGCAVFPTHWIEANGCCSCGTPDCKSPGKHPLNKGWQAEATADESQIRQQWKRFPLANIGIACGKASNLTVLDVDGQVGADTLRDLELQHGELPANTPSVLTGSGGRHYYFAHQPGLSNAVRFTPGLDIRTDGGLVVGAGSINGNGPYVWDVSATIGRDGCERTQMPAWMVELIAKASASSSNGGGFRASDHPIHEGEGRNNYLYRLGRSEKARGLPDSTIRAAMDAVNREQCKPPLDQGEFEALVDQVLHQPDRPGFDKRSVVSDASFDPSSYDWPNPQQIPIGLPPVPTLDDLLLPDALRPWLVDIAERAQAPLDFPAIGAIVALSSAIGRRAGIRPKRHDDWIVVPNLWGLTVGPPGVLKSPMLHEVLKPLARLEAAARDTYRTEIAKYDLKAEALAAERKRAMNKAARPKAEITREALMAELDELRDEPPSRRRYIVNDPTVEKLGEILNENPGGVLLFRDEIAGFLATMDRSGHENDRAFYLEAWNGAGRYSYDRIGRGTLDIEAVCVSILGALTPGPLSAYLRETFSGAKDDGLIQRFQLAVYPDLTDDWRNVDRWPDTEAEHRAVAIFERFVSFGGDSPGGEIPTSRFDDEAQRFFDAWRTDLETRLRNPDQDPVMHAHLAKYRSLMPSLALIFHLCDAAPNCPVNIEAAKRAAAWCDYLEAHARRIYHCVTARAATAARLLGERLRNRKLPSPFRTRDVYRLEWTGLTEREDVQRALELLEDLGWVRREQIAPTEQGGRPSSRYHVNPRIWQ